MKIEYLKEFLDLAETLNFTKTATKRFITQPALSNHISIVEEVFGLKLLIRSTHNVKLTEEGKIFYERLKKLILEYDQIIRDANAMANNLLGTLTFGILYYAVPQYVYPIVEKFQEYYPNLALKTVSCQPHQIYQLLKDDVIDAGMVVYFGDEEPDSLEYYTFKKEKLCFMLPVTHPLAMKTELSLEDIMEETIVDEIMDVEWNQSITNLIHKNGFYPKKIVHAPQVDLMPLVIEKTNGISIVPELLAQNMYNDRMAFRKIIEDGFEYRMGICYKADNKNPALKHLKEICDEISLL